MSSEGTPEVDEQHRPFVKNRGINAEDARRRREDLTVSIRKNKREESLQKRRFAIAEEGPALAQVSESLGTYLQGIRSTDIQHVRAAVEGIRKLLSVERNPPITEVIQAGVVPQLIEFLHSQDEALQYEALWALTNIASGTHDHAQILVHLDVLPHFQALLRSNVHRVREQACWALGNIAGDCAEMRDRVLSLGVMRDTLNLLVDQGSRLSLIRIATWTMSNLCRGKPQPSFSLVREAIPVAAQLIFSTDKEVLVDALWTLSFLSDGKDKKQKAVADANVCPQLVSLLHSNELQFLVPALRTIGNLMSGDDSTTSRVIEAGALQKLAPLLAHTRHGVRKEACWTVSNVLAGTTKQIQAAIDAKLIPPILHCLHEDRFDIRKEAAWCIANAVSGASNSQVVYFVQQQCIETLCHLLYLPDVPLLDMILEALDRVLKVGNRIMVSQKLAKNPFRTKVEDCGGLDKIETLQDHPNVELYEKASHIIKTYFEGEDDEDDANMAPGIDNDQFQFGGGAAPQGGFNFGGFQ